MPCIDGCTWQRRLRGTHCTYVILHTHRIADGFLHGACNTYLAVSPAYLCNGEQHATHKWEGEGQTTKPSVQAAAKEGVLYETAHQHASLQLASPISCVAQMSFDFVLSLH